MKTFIFSLLILTTLMTSCTKENNNDLQAIAEQDSELIQAKTSKDVKCPRTNIAIDLSNPAPGMNNLVAELTKISNCDAAVAAPNCPNDAIAYVEEATAIVEIFQWRLTGQCEYHETIPANFSASDQDALIETAKNLIAPEFATCGFENAVYNFSVELSGFLEDEFGCEYRTFTLRVEADTWCCIYTPF